eukprot:scaffold32774_cov65-Phaeocystis_antarctica.AAC.2
MPHPGVGSKLCGRDRQPWRSRRHHGSGRPVAQRLGRARRKVGAMCGIGATSYIGTRIAARMPGCHPPGITLAGEAAEASPLARLA